MLIDNISNYNSGWLVGDFPNSLIRSQEIEVAHHHYEPDYHSQPHRHNIITEINYIISGELIVNDKQLKMGDIFIFEAGEISNVKFLTPTELLIIKYPSVPTDKEFV